MSKQSEHVGFTGTRDGMTVAQKDVLWHMLTIAKKMGGEYFHHGDCFGADAQAHAIAVDIGFYTIIHPPHVDEHRAYCEGNVYEDPLPYLDRNKKIVDVSSCLFAAPNTSIEKLRSGTWSTIRYGNKQNKPVFIVTPQGKLKGY